MEYKIKRKQYYKNLHNKDRSFAIIEKGDIEEIKAEKDFIYDNLPTDMNFIQFILDKNLLDDISLIYFYYDFLVKVFFEKNGNLLINNCFMLIKDITYLNSYHLNDSNIL